MNEGNRITQSYSLHNFEQTKDKQNVFNFFFWGRERAGFVQPFCIQDKTKIHNMIDKIIELYIENVDFHLENSTSRVEIGLQLKLQFQDTLKLVEYNYFMYTIQR